MSRVSICLLLLLTAGAHESIADDLRFTGPEATWPPRPADRTRERQLPLDPEIPGSVTSELRKQLPKLVARDPRARRLLGARFALVDVEEPSLKGAQPDIQAGPRAIVTFYSRTNGWAVLAKTCGRVVTSVELQRDAQPHAGSDEVVQAVSLARADARIHAGARKLAGGATLNISKRGEPGFGHRVLYVVFAKCYGLQPRYSANVDLTDRRVLSAGRADREGR